MARCFARTTIRDRKSGTMIADDVKLKVNPVVVLSRLSEEEIRRRTSRSSAKTSFTAEKDPWKGYSDKKYSEMCDGDDTPSSSESDEELPEITFYRKSSGRFTRSQRDEVPPGQSKYVANLLNLIERQIKVEESRVAYLKLEEQLHSLESKSSPFDLATSNIKDELSGIFLNNRFEDKGECNESGDIEDAHPGKTILDFSTAGKLFTRDQLTFEEIKDPKTPFDEMLKESPPDILDEIIQRESFILHFENITDKCAAVRLLFRLLSVHEDYFVADKCKETLLAVLRKDPLLADSITLKDMIDVFINYGSTLDKLIPVAELFRVGKNLGACDVDVNNNKKTATWTSLPIHCLENVMQAIRALISCSNVNIADAPEHLMILVVVLCNFALDKSLRTVAEVVEIKLTIDVILQTFTDEHWSNQIVGCLARYLSSLSDEPHDLVVVARMFFHSERGHQLKRLSSYFMVNRLLKPQVQLENLKDVLPLTVLNFVNSVSWKQHVKLYFLYHVLTLVDLSVGCNFINGNWKIFEELSRVIRLTVNGIKNNKSLDATKIRDLVTRIHLHWQILANSAPVSQRTMFSYFNVVQTDAAVES